MRRFDPLGYPHELLTVFRNTQPWIKHKKCLARLALYLRGNSDGTELLGPRDKGHFDSITRRPRKEK